MAALPHVLAAPTDRTQVRQLTFRPGFNLRTHPDRLRLTPAEGVPGERWLAAPWLRLPDGRPDPDIQVSILPQGCWILCACRRSSPTRGTRSSPILIPRSRTCRRARSCRRAVRRCGYPGCSTTAARSGRRATGRRRRRGSPGLGTRSCGCGASFARSWRQGRWLWGTRWWCECGPGDGFRGAGWTIPAGMGGCGRCGKVRERTLARPERAGETCGSRSPGRGCAPGRRSAGHRQEMRADGGRSQKPAPARPSTGPIHQNRVKSVARMATCGMSGPFRMFTTCSCAILVNARLTTSGPQGRPT